MGKMENHLQQQTPTRKIGLSHLFAMTAFVMPIFATVAALRRSGSATLGYLLAVPSAVVLSILIVSTDWKLGRAIWLRFESQSERVKNAVGIALFAFQLFWIFIGLVTGDKLAGFVINHLAR